MCHDKKRTCENYAKDSLYLIKILVKMDRQWQRAWKWGYVACNWKISHCQWIKRHFQNENEKALSLLSRDFYEYYTSVVIIFTNTLSSFFFAHESPFESEKKARFKLFSLKSFFSISSIVCILNFYRIIMLGDNFALLFRKAGRVIKGSQPWFTVEQ